MRLLVPWFNKEYPSFEPVLLQKAIFMSYLTAEVNVVPWAKPSFVFEKRHKENELDRFISVRDASNGRRLWAAIFISVAIIRRRPFPFHVRES